MINVKSIRMPPKPSDGKRYFIGRSWPEGVTEREAAIDGWLKELAPSQELLDWNQTHPLPWEEFESRYLVDLKPPSNKEQTALIQRLDQEAEQDTVTLLYEGDDPERNNATVVRRVLKGKD